MNDFEYAKKLKECEECIRKLCYYECPVSKDSLYHKDMMPVELWLPMMNKNEVKELISECSKGDLILSLGVMSRHCITKIFDAIEDVDEKIDLCREVRPFMLELIGVEKGIFTPEEAKNDFEVIIRPAVRRLSEKISNILFKHV